MLNNVWLACVGLRVIIFHLVFFFGVDAFFAEITLVGEGSTVSQDMFYQVHVLVDHWFLLELVALVVHFQIGKQRLHNLRLNFDEFKAWVLAIGTLDFFTVFQHSLLAVVAQNFVAALAFLEFNRNLVANDTAQIFKEM